MIEIVSCTVLAALCCVGGWFFTLNIFKKKEIEFSGKKKIAFETASAVLLEAMAVVISLFLAGTGILNIYEALRSVLVICALLFAGLIDFKLMIIPNKLTLFLLTATVIVYAAELIISQKYIITVLTEALLGCAVCFLIFFIGKMISRKGMGMGDIKLTAVMGLALGLNTALGCLLWAMIIASIMGIVMLISKKLKAKSKMAMAPFFFVGTIVGHIVLSLGGPV